MQELMMICNEFTQQYKHNQRDYKEMNEIINKLSKVINQYQEKKVVVLPNDEYKKTLTEKEKIIQENNKMEHEINNLKMELLSKNNKLNNIQKIGKNFTKKIDCILSLRKTFGEMFSTKGIVGGSFIRQLFEISFSLSELFETNGYANCIGRDIDIYIYQDDWDCCENKKNNIINKIKDLNNFIKFHRYSPQIFPPIKFGEYELCDITDSTIYEVESTDSIGKKKLIGIPHYLFVLKDSNNIQLTIDILAWIPKSDIYYTDADFDINKIQLMDDGIYCRNFDEILYHIMKKEASCLVNLELLHDSLKQITLRTNKLPSLNQLIFFMTNRIKIISTGYKFCSENTIPEIYIEKKEICGITCVSPPYISLKLVCNHTLSIMAFVGLINEQSEYTESLRCPYCRSDLLLNFIINKPTNIISWKPFEPPIEKNNENFVIEKVDEIPLYSTESKEYIKNIINKKEQEMPLLDNNINNSPWTITQILPTITRHNNTNASIADPNGS
jgi:hypothetical protein